MEKINVTFQCNNNCKYCPINRNVCFAEPSLNYIKSSIDKIKDKGDKRITLTGGESLLRRDIFKIIQYAKKQGFELELKTNGRIAFYKQYAKELVKTGIDKVILYFPSSNPETFDNITQTKGSYFQTIIGIENLISLGVNLEINIVISKKNYKELKDIFTLLKRIGIKNIRLSFPELKGNALKYSKEIIPSLSEISQYFKEALESSKDMRFHHIFIDNHLSPLLRENKGFIVTYDDNIKMYDLQTKSEEGLKEKEMHVYLQVNSVCNQKCVFCNRPPTDDYNKGEIVSIKKIKDKINELSKDRYIKRIIFTGGEPTLHPKLSEIIHYTKRYGFVTEIQTNGTLLNSDKLHDLKKAGLNIINFAFHSHKKNISNKLRGVDFGHEKIISNLKLANKIGFEMHIIHVINSMNYQDLPEFIDYVNNMHLHNLYLNLSIVVPEGWAWENKWIIPRMRDIKPYLIEAMKRCKKYNINFDVSEIVPLCIVNGFEDYAISTNFKFSNVKISDDYYSGKRTLDFANPSSEYAAKAPQCKDCSVNEICAGFYPRLKELYGTDDFIPRHDEPPLLSKLHRGNKIIGLVKDKALETVSHKGERNPNTLYINLDEKCNENCVFCVVKGSNEGKFGSMDTKEAERIIKEFIEQGGETLVFTGGEPTLRDDLPGIIKYAEQFQGLKSISIITNGVRLSEKDYLNRLMNSDKDNKLSFCFSLHSHKEEVSELLTNTKGTFKKTISGIENVIKKRRNVSIYQVVTSKNYRDILEFSKFLNDNYPEIKDITFAYPFPQGNALLNKWIYVKLSLLRPYFLKALKSLENKGYTINIAACGQFPLCIVPGFEEKIIHPLLASEKDISGVIGERAFHDFEMASKQWVDQYKGKTKECKKCILNKYCQGFWKEYIELFGFDGIQQISKNNFQGNKIESSLKNENQIQEITKKTIRNKMNLIVITDYTKNYLDKLINSLKTNRILAVILCGNNILYS